MVMVRSKERKQRKGGREEKKVGLRPLKWAPSQLRQCLDIWRILQGKGNDAESNTDTERLSSLSVNDHL